MSPLVFENDEYLQTPDESIVPPGTTRCHVSFKPGGITVCVIIDALVESFLRLWKQG